MGWFRAYRKFGGRLALFALALQFYLSFAHIHPDDIYGPVGQVVVRRRRRSICLRRSRSTSIPAGQPWYSGDALCPICETIYFLSNSFTPDAPAVLPLTFSSRPAEHAAASRPFSSRRGAPPSNPAPHPSPDPPRSLLNSVALPCVHARGRHQSACGFLQISSSARDSTTAISSALWRFRSRSRGGDHVQSCYVSVPCPERCCSRGPRYWR